MSLLGDVANFFLTQDTNKANRNFQREINEENWKHHLYDQWYDSPEQQVQRLKAAGLSPGLMYQGGSVASSSPSAPAQASRDVAPLLGGMFNPIELERQRAEIAQIKADTRKTESETKYQDYLNAIEEELSHIPIGSVHVTTEDGKDVVQVQFGNARVETSKAQLKMLGLSEQGLQYQLSDLFYDLAVKVGNYSFTDNSTFSPSSSPNFESDSAALRGDAKVRALSGELAQIGYDAAKAEKAGREAYSKWLDEHKDDPVVKFALTLQGFFQTLGISLPSFGVKGTKGENSSKSWYFGN